MPIPKFFFTYWEGDQLSRLHYYTIYSLRKNNPDTPITIYTSTDASSSLVQWRTGEHSIRLEKTLPLQALKDIDSSNISIVPIDFQTEYGIRPDISVVFKADFIRIAKLYEHGGMWFDMDILFVKPIPAHLFTSDVDLYYFTYQATIPTGLLFTSQNNPLLKELFTEAQRRMQTVVPGAIHPYQMIGPDLWKVYFIRYGSLCSMHCLSTSDVYPYDCDTIVHVYGTENRIQENTFGVHWYNGHRRTKEYINGLDITALHPDRCIMDRLIQNML